MIKYRKPLTKVFSSKNYQTHTKTGIRDTVPESHLAGCRCCSRVRPAAASTVDRAVSVPLEAFVGGRNVSLLPIVAVFAFEGITPVVFGELAPVGLGDTE